MQEYYLRIFAIKHIFCNFAAVLGKKGFWKSHFEY